MAVAAAAGGTRAPAVKEEASARPLGEVVNGWSRGRRGDFERGSVVEVVVAEVGVGREGGERGEGGTVS